MKSRSQWGFTLVEVLVAMALLSLLLVPAISALQTAIEGAEVHGDVAVSRYRISSRLEELLAEPFTDLSDAAIAAGGPTTPSSYSEPAGPPGRLLVYLSQYDGDDADGDGDPFTGTDPDLLWIRVEIDGSVHELSSIIAQGY